MAEQKGLVVAFTAAATEITGDITAIDQAIDTLSARGYQQVLKRTQEAREKLVKALGANVDGAAAIAAATAFDKDAAEVDAQDKALRLAILRLSDQRQALVEHPSDGVIKSLEDVVIRLKELVSSNLEEHEQLRPRVDKAEQDLATARKAREALLAADERAPFTADYLQTQHNLDLAQRRVAATPADEKKKAE